MAGLRDTFNTQAERYDRARPAYPSQVIDDLGELAAIGPGSRVLEIGCGTGQATIPLAERGCSILAVEIGSDLAAVARRNLAAFPNVEVVIAAFEEWPLPAQPFDAVVTATAFHWIDPDVRVGKAADALRPGGALAIIDTEHVAGGDEAFFAAAQACYEHWDPSTPPGLRLQPADRIPMDSREIESSGRFGPVTYRRYERDLGYSRAEYLDLLQTYSGHIALEASDRDGLLECIGQLIDRDFGGRITKRYLTQLRVARRLDRKP